MLKSATHIYSANLYFQITFTFKRGRFNNHQLLESDAKRATRDFCSKDSLFLLWLTNYILCELLITYLQIFLSIVYSSLKLYHQNGISSSVILENTLYTSSLSSVLTIPFGSVLELSFFPRNSPLTDTISVV